MVQGQVEPAAPTLPVTFAFANPSLRMAAMMTAAVQILDVTGNACWMRSGEQVQILMEHE
jgi:hypothetical protein